MLAHIRIPTYGRTLNVLVTNNLKKSLKKHGLEGLMEWQQDYRAFFTWHEDDGIKYPFIVFNKESVTSHEVVAHEALHATAFILEDSGINFCEETEEAYAYLLGYIVGEIHKLTNK